MSRRKLWIAAAVVAALAVVWFTLGGRGKAAAKPRLAAVERGHIVASVSATGTVEPVIQVEVGSQVSGTLARLYADYNDTVREGQVLAELEPSLFRATVAMSEANVAKAEAALHEAERAARRARELKDRNLISEVDLDAAISSFEQRRAELGQARASLQSARVNLGHTVIRAPISGVVISRQVDVGQTVAASLQAPKLFVLARDLTRMQVETKIDEADVGRLRTGQTATFTVDAFPDDSFEGIVAQVRLEPVVTDNVVTYTTVIDVPNPGLKLRPGMTANVTIVTDARHDALKVPNAALRFHPPDAGGHGGEARMAFAAAGRGVAGGPGGMPRGGMARGGGAGRPAHGRDPAGADRDSASAPGAIEAPAARMQRVYVLGEDRRMKPVSVATGITDGAFTEVTGGELRPGMQVVVGLEGASPRNDLPAPPGFGAGRGPH